MHQDAFQALSEALRGELDCSSLGRLLYSQDASIYQEEPLGVVYPADADDLQVLTTWAGRHGIPLIPRAGGTSLAGQCVGRGLVMDVSRHMNRILSIDAERREATVEPGVIQDDLNDAAAAYGLQFAPDTSTSRQACIGGMIGNNSCGAYSILHGTTRDHVRELSLVTAEGTVLHCRPLEEEALAAHLAEPTPEGEVYRTVCGLVEEHRDLIRARYPRPDLIRRNMGYALDALTECRPWQPRGRPFSLVPLLCGSEGTLGLIAKAVVQLIPRPKHCRLVCSHFSSVEEAARATVATLAHQPAAVELMDGHLLEATRGNREQAGNRFWVRGQPGAVLAIELHGEEVESRMQALVADLKNQGLGYTHVDIRETDRPRVWALRKAGLGLLTGQPGDTKSVTAIEDTAVHPDDLPAYLADMTRLLKQHQVECVFYGHASVGLIHLRPMLNLKQAGDLATFTALMEETAILVKRYRGCLSGEHGDGRLRSPYLAGMLGADLAGLHQDIKRAFDPAGIFNPGKIVEPGPATDALRVHPDSRTPDLDTVFDWSHQQGLVRAVENCNGAGFCRQTAGRGAMCPSYMATGNEAFSTRGRANVLRHVLTGEAPETAWSRPELHEVLDTCLSCKACATECPSNIDMARMKAEVLQQRMDRDGIDPHREKYAHFTEQAERAARFPTLVNLLLRSRQVRRHLGVAPKRRLPVFARQTFSAWFRKHYLPTVPDTDDRPAVVLLNDEFTNSLEPATAIAACRVLGKAGYRVRLADGLNSGRSLISQGFLREARRILEQALEQLQPFVDLGVPMIGLEPSALLGFRDEAPDLVRADLRPLAYALREHAQLFEEFVAGAAAQWVDAPWHSLPTSRILVHVHCHQKALSGTDPVCQALALIPQADITLLPSGCCGMAGSFGYQPKHYDLSLQIAEQILFPALRATPDALVCATGTSCRHQVQDGLQRHTFHPAELLAQALPPA